MKTKTHEVYPFLFVFALYAFSLINGLTSRDFGGHWDESIITSAVSRSYKSGLFVQDVGNYPSATYYLTLLASVPHLVGEITKEDPILTRDLKHTDGFAITQPSLRNALSRTGDYVSSKEFLLLARSVACAFVLLSIFWIYLIGRELFDSQLAGILAALVFFGSWEHFYHSRFLATDLIMVHFGLASMYALVRFLKRERLFDLFLCGFLAGLATAGKYQGGLYWLMSLAAIILFFRKSEFGLFKLLSLSFASYVAGFLLLNPMILLNPLAFIEGFLFVSEHYAGSIEGYTVPWRVDPGWSHGWLLLNYVVTQLSSKFVAISILTTLLAAVGVYYCSKDRHWKALVLMVFPIFYVFYFSGQSVMIVRNYLCLLPFLALFAAYGGLKIWNSGNRFARAAFLGFVSVATLFNSAWIYRSTSSIANYDIEANNAALVEILESEEEEILVSNEIWALLSDPQKTLRRSLNAASTSDAKYLAIGYELESWRLPANRPWNYRVLLGGPFEINFPYYPSFSRKWEKKWRFVEVSPGLVSKENCQWRFRGWPEGHDPISAAKLHTSSNSIHAALGFAIAMLQAEEQGDGTAALQKLFPLLENTPDLAEHTAQLNALGIQLESIEAHESAAKAFGFAAAHSSPIQGKAHFSKAKNLNLAARYSEALPVWLELDRLYPGLLDVKLGGVTAMIGSGQKTDALAAANQLRAMLESAGEATHTPQQCIAMNSIAVSIASWSQYELAASIFGYAANSDSPIRGKAAFSQANCLNLARSYKKALPLWLKLEKQYPSVTAVQAGKASAITGLSEASQ